MNKSVLTLAALALATGFSACTKSADAAAPTELRISCIPDNQKAKLEAVMGSLTAFLTKEAGIPCKYVPSNDYDMSVNGMLSNSLDLCWYGGVTFVDANKRSNGEVEVVACRDIDLKFKSYVIAGKKLVDGGAVAKVNKLEDLKPLLAKHTFRFGPRKSTSGHIMPRHFLTQAGINPEADVKDKPQYSGAGGHGETFTAVSTGAADIGVLNYSAYDKLSEAERATAPIIYTTPDYVDYCFAAHKGRLGADVIAKIRTALTKLDPAVPEQKAILDAFGAGRFVAASSAQWDPIRKIMDSMPKDFWDAK